MFACKILTLTILMVLQDIHGMPQREARKFACVVANSNKNQEWSVQYSHWME